jgi:hypothetical protein
MQILYPTLIGQTAQYNDDAIRAKQQVKQVRQAKDLRDIGQRQETTPQKPLTSQGFPNAGAQGAVADKSGQRDKVEYEEGEQDGLTFKGPNPHGMHTADSKNHGYGIGSFGGHHHLYVSAKKPMAQTQHLGKFKSMEEAKLAAHHHMTQYCESCK